MANTHYEVSLEMQVLDHPTPKAAAKNFLAAIAEAHHLTLHATDTNGVTTPVTLTGDEIAKCLGITPDAP